LAVLSPNVRHFRFERFAVLRPFRSLSRLALLFALVWTASSCSNPETPATGSAGHKVTGENGRMSPAGSAAEANKKKGEEFLAANKTKEGVKTLPDGIQYIVLKEGTGKHPKATDRVTVHYHGTLIDGTVFDSSVKRGEPASFALNQVIPGWTEVVQLMKEGSKWRVFIPPNLAYGEHPRPGGPIGPNETLIFEIELLKVE
jgi:FKBP-type peptidyl-prolyl cis-trans isomerase